MSTGWSSFPLYIYRNYNIAFDKRKANSPLGKDVKQIAEKANDYFQYGDEARALYLYKSLLYRHSSLFDQRPEHLWNLAEIYLGNNNTSIAKSYYLSIIEKFPGTEYSKFAKLRVEDINSLVAIENDNLDALTKLSMDLDGLETTNKELKAEKLIRSVYWNQPLKSNYTEKVNNGYLPKVSYKQYTEALKLRPAIIHPKTKFLLDTIVASYQLDEEYKWTKSSLNQILEYAKRYNDYYNGSFALNAKKKALSRLREVINQQFSSNNYTNIVDIYDAIPKDLKDKPNDFKTSWAIAYSYDQANQYKKASEMYNHSSKLANNDSDILKSDFNALKSIENEEDMSIVSEKSLSAQDKKQTKILEDKLLSDWMSARPTTKTQMYNIYRLRLKDELNKEKPKKVYLEILSDMWNSPLSKDAAMTTPDRLANLITLKEKLKSTGLALKAKKTEQTLLKLDATLINTNPENEELWATEMSRYANNLRLENKYFESAEAYKQIADKTRTWVNRAESYYKSGLLFYKAGKRSEAVSAFEKASNIKDSSLYSKLAKDRLDQIQE